MMLFIQAEDGIRDAQESRGLGDVYKRQVFEADERILIFTLFASWDRRLAEHLTARYEMPIDCYDGSLARGGRDRMVAALNFRKTCRSRA